MTNDKDIVANKRTSVRVNKREIKIKEKDIFMVSKNILYNKLSNTIRYLL